MSESFIFEKEKNSQRHKAIFKLPAFLNDPRIFKNKKKDLGICCHKNEL